MILFENYLLSLYIRVKLNKRVTFKLQNIFLIPSIFQIKSSIGILLLFFLEIRMYTIISENCQQYAIEI